MKQTATVFLILLLLMLAVAVCSCITYVAREEDSTPAPTDKETTEVTWESDTDAESDTTADVNNAETEPDTAYPNEPDDNHSKRY